ncbi:NAD(+)/NADH kinase [Desulfovibrio sp. OttesenSCG-928-G15]|nr:NAD(+)/NADH kinase [Desulfovibrio sp. OttesenSCG-928-G15]
MKRIASLRRIGLVVKEGNEAGMKTGRIVEKWLSERGIESVTILHPCQHVAECLPKETDLLLVLAGDGTMVSVARQALGMNIPIAGINFGKVGFLAELDFYSWEKALERAISKGLPVEQRMSLHFSLRRGQDTILQGEVINDVVVTRGKVARLVSLLLGVNGAPFIALRSDGLILSTPTGASGYAGSAGGPLLLPTLNNYVVAAICPYLSSFPPLVLEHGTRFSVKVGEAAPDLYLTLDGQEAHPLAEGDVLTVSGMPGRILVADFMVKDYFKRLRQVGFVQESKRTSRSSQE